MRIHIVIGHCRCEWLPGNVAGKRECRLGVNEEVIEDVTVFIENASWNELSEETLVERCARFRRCLSSTGKFAAWTRCAVSRSRWRSVFRRWFSCGAESLVWAVMLCLAGNATHPYCLGYI